MKWFLPALVLAAGPATHAIAEPCQSLGDPQARSVGMPASSKSVSPYIAWTFLVARELEAVRPNRSETCARGPFRLGTQVFSMSGENGEAIPRKAVSVSADGPIVMLVPLSIQRLRLDYPEVVPKGKAPFYMIVVSDNGVLTAERVLQGIPIDEQLIGEFGLALTKANTMARLGPGEKQATLVLPIAGDKAKAK